MSSGPGSEEMTEELAKAIIEASKDLTIAE